MGATERVLIVEDELHALAGLAALTADQGSNGPAGADGDSGYRFNPHY